MKRPVQTPGRDHPRGAVLLVVLMVSMTVVLTMVVAYQDRGNVM